MDSTQFKMPLPILEAGGAPRSSSSKNWEEAPGRPAFCSKDLPSQLGCGQTSGWIHPLRPSRAAIVCRALFWVPDLLSCAIRNQGSVGGVGAEALVGGGVHSPAPSLHAGSHPPGQVGPREAGGKARGVLDHGHQGAGAPSGVLTRRCCWLQLQSGQKRNVLERSESALKNWAASCHSPYSNRWSYDPVATAYLRPTHAVGSPGCRTPLPPPSRMAPSPFLRLSSHLELGGLAGSRIGRAGAPAVSAPVGGS